MADGEAEKKSLLSKDVLDYIVGKKEALGGMTKAQMYERSLKRWRWSMQTGDLDQRFGVSG